MQTYRYEVLVTKKYKKGNPCMDVLREAQRIGGEVDLMTEPSREQLLLKYAPRLAEFEGVTAIKHPETEVVINIRPFCR